MIELVADKVIISNMIFAVELYAMLLMLAKIIKQEEIEDEKKENY